MMNISFCRRYSLKGELFLYLLIFIKSISSIQLVHCNTGIGNEGIFGKNIKKVISAIDLLFTKLLQYNV